MDIGTYNTCLHGCAYCYATFNRQMSFRNRDAHDPASPFLVGGPTEPDTPKDPEQPTLFD